MKVKEISTPTSSSSPQELPIPGPSSVLGERERLIKLKETHSTETLQDALNIRVTVEMAAVALLSKVANDFDTVLLQSTVHS